MTVCETCSGAGAAAELGWCGDCGGTGVER